MHNDSILLEKMYIDVLKIHTRSKDHPLKEKMNLFLTG